MNISRTLTPKRRAILRADVRSLLADPGGVLAHWRAYYQEATNAKRRAEYTISDASRRRHLNDAATCLALAIAARKRARGVAAR